MYKIVFISLPLMMMSACGDQNENFRAPVFQDTQNARPEFESGYVLRGRWVLEVGAGDGVDGFALLNFAAANQTVTASVASRVRFVVDSSNILQPANPEDGQISYGSLEVTDLRDNDLVVCGAGGDSKCSESLLRIYSTGKPGGGLWNDDEGYGIPILSDGNVIGLGVPGSYGISTYNIPANQRVVRLADFSSGGSLSIPLAVDFTDAGAGEFSTTLVIEYVSR